MRLRSPRLLALGGVLFLLGTIFLFLWLGGQARLFLVLGIGLLPVSALTLAVGGRWVGNDPDALELRQQRRLWLSGPLGRWWLARRKRLP